MTGGDDHATDTVTAARGRYAEALRTTGHVAPAVLIRAFATVLRERVLAPGSWRIRESVVPEAGYQTTPEADLPHIYRDVLADLDGARGIDKGSPALWAGILDKLDTAVRETVMHRGCGTGYSVIPAELVGTVGNVPALEQYPQVAERARTALLPWPHVVVGRASLRMLSVQALV